MFFLNNIVFNFQLIILSASEYLLIFSRNLWNLFLNKINFLPKYYRRNENIWNDGFLFDFLQKKTFDSWIRQYVIYTGFLFSERVVFDAVIRVYNDLIIWPAHKFSIFENSNTSSMLNTIIFLYFSFFVVLVLLLTIVIY